jgi:hypothetical protein
MDLLVSHWHCIVPIVVIGIASILMNRKKQEPRSKKPELGGNDE